MTLNIDQITFETDIPKLPQTAPVVRVKAPDLDQRMPGMHALGEKLRLGETQSVDTQFGMAMASKQGEVEYFQSSGAIWSTNLSASERRENEMMEWKGLDRTKGPDGEPVFTLDRNAQGEAMELAREMADIGGFDLKHADKPSLSMVQVAELSEKGEILQEGAGEATMSFGFNIEGLPVLGAGAKAMIDAGPGRDGRLMASGAVNVWRTPVGAEKIDLGGTEAIFAAGLLEDPDLNLSAEKDGRIIIEELEFGLMSLPAMMRQGFLFPILRVAGRVELAKEEHHYHFGRFCPAASGKTYAKAGLLGDFLNGVH